jgi:hypothetical protein
MTDERLYYNQRKSFFYSTLVVCGVKRERRDRVRYNHVAF